MSIRPAIWNLPRKHMDITEEDTIGPFVFSDILKGGAALDLTGVGIKYQIRDSKGGLLYGADGSDGITVDANSFTLESFKAPVRGKHGHEVEFTFPGDVVRTWIKGHFNVSKQIVV